MKEKIMIVDEAAEFLHMHPDSLRRKALDYRIPHTMVGGKLLFIESRLVSWLISRERTREDSPCHSSKGTVPGTLISLSKVKECAAALRPASKGKRKN